MVKELGLRHLFDAIWAVIFVDTGHISTHRWWQDSTFASKLSLLHFIFSTATLRSAVLFLRVETSLWALGLFGLHIHSITFWRRIAGASRCSPRYQEELTWTHSAGGEKNKHSKSTGVAPFSLVPSLSAPESASEYWAAPFDQKSPRLLHHRWWLDLWLHLRPLAARQCGHDSGEQQRTRLLHHCLLIDLILVASMGLLAGFLHVFWCTRFD